MRSVVDIMRAAGELTCLRKTAVRDVVDGRTVDGLFALVDSSGDAIPGVGVGSRYTVLQNEELAAMADELALTAGLVGEPQVRYWGGGRRVSVILPVDRFGVGLDAADVTEARFRLDNSHGGGAVRTSLEFLRLVCSNGLVRLIRHGTATIPHTASVERRTRLAVEALGRGREGIREYANLARRLADRALSQDEVRAFFLAVHAAEYGPMVEPDGAPRQSAVLRVAAWVRAMEDPRQSVAGVQGTAWAALQSVTQWADHEAPARNRAASADHGRLARLKAAALAKIVAIAR